ncbi:MAG TPA: TlpA disulfide reductase family protein [Thermoguttaceae bacterium]|nr:TlpA disulfide reductase family protein [Thermoguttaceae bacterium]
MSQGEQLQPSDSRRSPAGCFVVAVTAMVVFVTMLFLGGVLATVLFPHLLEWNRPAGQEQPGIGGKLTRLELVPLTGGGEVLTLDDLDGQVVLLSFLGTWNEPSREELLHIAAVGEKFQDRKDFTLLAVSCGRAVRTDPRQLRLDTVSLLDEKGIRMATYADPDHVSRLAVDEVVGFADYPTTLVLDRSGTVRGVWSGSAAEGEMEALIEKLLEK